MIVEAQVDISGSKEQIWGVITDFERAPQIIRGIDRIEILEKPSNGLTGLRWRETRTLFGRTAVEEMTITEAAENEYFRTRAESHGCVYVGTMKISDGDGGSTLTMTLDASPQTILVRLLSLPMGLLFRGATRKAMLNDLNDLKEAVEKAGRDRR